MLIVLNISINLYGIPLSTLITEVYCIWSLERGTD